MASKRAALLKRLQAAIAQRRRPLDAQISTARAELRRLETERRQLVRGTSRASVPQLERRLRKLGAVEAPRGDAKSTRANATRAEVAAKANFLAAESRHGSHAPRLASDSGVGTVTAWLRWQDPNGDHVYDTPREAWQALGELVRDMVD